MTGNQADRCGSRTGSVRHVRALTSWLNPVKPAEPAAVQEPARRRALVIELVIVLSMTLGFSALQSLLTLLDALLRPESLADQSVAINESRSELGLLDLGQQLINVLRLFAWGALGVYLLWRGGIGPRLIGLDRARPGSDAWRGLGLAALIGLPGLAFYLIAHTLGISLTVQPSTLDAWWSAPVLALSAVGNSVAEEVLVVAYLLTRLRQLGWGENRALWFSSFLRGAYHLYQGFGGFLGNIVMGLVYGRVWQRTHRLWPLIIGHAAIDVVAFVGYSLLRDQISWLP